MKARKTSTITALLIGLTMTLGSCAVVAERGYYRPAYRYHYYHDYPPRYYRPYRGSRYRYRLYYQNDAGNPVTPPRLTTADGAA